MGTLSVLVGKASRGEDFWPGKGRPLKIICAGSCCLKVSVACVGQQDGTSCSGCMGRDASWTPASSLSPHARFVLHPSHRVLSRLVCTAQPVALLSHLDALLAHTTCAFPICPLPFCHERRAQLVPCTPSRQGPMMDAHVLAIVYMPLTPLLPPSLAPCLAHHPLKLPVLLTTH